MTSKTLQGGQSERSGWRDQEISSWVRSLGNVPFADLDFVGVTFDQLEPVAIIDWKRETKRFDSDSWASVEAIKRLADRAMLPFFVVYYSAGQTSFLIRPKNALAQAIVAEEKRATPRQFVRFLFWLSGREGEADLLAKFSNELPAEVVARIKADEEAFDRMFGGK